MERMKTMGIMTTRHIHFSPFPEEAYYRELSEEGMKHHLKVFVFFPDQIEPFGQRISGYILNEGRWKKKNFPYPALIYDRVFYTAESLKRDGWKVAQLKKNGGILFLNRGLPNKWEQYLTLKENPKLSPYLPPQTKYEYRGQLGNWLREGDVILKPISGGFGKGVLHLVASPTALLEGRTKKNLFFRKSYPSVEDMLNSLIPRLTSRYLVQPYLSLTTEDGAPFDIRLFMQKDEEGVWRKIGQGVRIGEPYHLTSNLHGGGRTMTLQAFRRLYRGRIPEGMEEELSRIGDEVATTLEKKYAPLFEIGLDMGVDRDHHLWILEANGKPGREIFRQMGDMAGMKTARLGPIRYALYLEKKGVKRNGILPHENHPFMGENR